MNGMNRGYMINKGGEAVFYKIIPASYKKKFPKMFGKYKYMVLEGFYVSEGLKSMGIEVNAGGNMFNPRAYKRKTLRGLSFDQIKKIQKKY